MCCKMPTLAPKGLFNYNGSYTFLCHNQFPYIFIVFSVLSHFYPVKFYIKCEKNRPQANTTLLLQSNTIQESHHISKLFRGAEAPRRVQRLHAHSQTYRQNFPSGSMSRAGWGGAFLLKGRSCLFCANETSHLWHRRKRVVHIWRSISKRRHNK